MKYWIALKRPTEFDPITFLDSCEARTQDEAYWKFSQMGVYPKYVVEIPVTVWEDTDLEDIREGTDYGGYE